MEILDNATIVRNLSDPTLLGNVWSMAEGLIGMVDFMEKIKSIENKHHKYTIADEDSYYNYIQLLESFSKQWSESLDMLNLEDLDRWLINDSTDISQLEFRLKQTRCRTGKMWNKDDAHQLHTDLLHITDRLADIIIGLKDNAFMCMYDLQAVETNARNDAVYIRNFVCKWLRDVLAIQERVKKIIDSAEQILNPQPTQTEKEQTDSQRDHNKLLGDMEIKSVFDEIVAMGLMTYRDGFYWWETDNVLLSYLCSQISRYKELSKQMRGRDYLPNWRTFEGLFKVKGKSGKWLDASHLKLAEYKKQYKKEHDDFNPDGCKQIDEVMSKYLI